MKPILILFILLNSVFLFGQQEYKWINVPYASNNMAEYPFVDEYLNLHGPVKKLEQNIGNNPSIPPLSRDLVLKFNPSGQLLYVKQFIADIGLEEVSSYRYYELEYDSAGHVINEMKTMVDKGDTVFYRKKDDVSWFWTKAPNPVKVNAKGHSLVFAMNGDTTYSFNDDWGRKTRDSIPDSGETMAHEIIYNYFEDSIAVQVNFSEWTEGNYVISYRLDTYGNWVEKRVSYQSDLMPMTIYRRRITYFNE